MTRDIGKGYDLGNAPLLQLSLKLAIPTALAQAVNVLYAIIDRMFIGHIASIGSIALAGVGVAAPITTLISSFAVLVGLGGAPIMAMKEGHGEHAKAEQVLAVAFWMLIALSITLTPLAIVLRKPLLMAFGASPRTFVYADQYLFWYILGTPFTILATGLNSYLINQGRSKEGMLTVLIGAILNIVLDPVFIFALDLGVRGGAIATVISQASSMILTMAFLRDRNTPIRLIPSRTGKDAKALVHKVLIFGLSPFMIISTDSILMIILNMMLQKYGGAEEGDMLITCSTIIQSFHLLVMNPMGGLTGGCQGMISYNFGAGNTERVRAGILTVQAITTVYCTLMLLATIFFKENFIRLFTSDDAVVEAAGKYMLIFESMIIPLSFQYTNIDCMTAMGQIRFSLPLSLMRKCIFLAASILLPVFTHIAATAFLSEPICDATAAVISTSVMWSQLPRILKKRETAGLSI